MIKSQSKKEKENPLNQLSLVELEILRYIKLGFTSSEIAQKRNCSPRTVEKHRSNIIRKLGIRSSQHALLLWLQDRTLYIDT